MNGFYELGEQVEAAWKGHGYAQKDFLTIARQELENARLHETDYQHAIPKPFTTPIELFYASRSTLPDSSFLVELRRPEPIPVIHDETFVGVSRVVNGAAIRTIYDFPLPSDTTAPYVVGDLQQLSATYLPYGTVLTSDGTRVIQSIYPLQPSPVLVIRTDQPTESPWYYYQPGLAFAEGVTFNDVRERNVADRARQWIRRLDACSRARAASNDEKLRFVIALLMTQDRRRFMLSLTSDYTKTSNPGATISTWIERLDPIDVLEAIKAGPREGRLKIQEEQAIVFLLQRVSRA